MELFTFCSNFTVIPMKLSHFDDIRTICRVSLVMWTDRQSIYMYWTTLRTIMVYMKGSQHMLKRLQMFWNYAIFFGGSNICHWADNAHCSGSSLTCFPGERDTDHRKYGHIRLYEATLKFLDSQLVDIDNPDGFAISKRKHFYYNYVCVIIPYTAIELTVRLALGWMPFLSP